MKGLAPPTLPLVATPSNEGVSRNLTPLRQLFCPKPSSQLLTCTEQSPHPLGIQAMSTSRNDELIDYLVVPHEPGRRFTVAEDTRWGGLIEPAPSEHSAKTAAGLRMVLFASWDFGYLVHETIKAFEKQYPEKLNLVGMVTDNPLNPDAKISVKKRVWKFLDFPYRVVDEALLIESSLSHGVPVYTGEIKVDSFRNILRAWNPDVILVCVFGQVIDSFVINLPRCGIYNFHPSNLEKGEGAGPAPYEDLVKRDAKTGVWAVHHVSEEIDTGKVVGTSPAINVRDIEGKLPTNPVVVYHKLAEVLSPMVFYLVRELVRNFDRKGPGWLEAIDYESLIPDDVKQRIMQPITGDSWTDIASIPEGIICNPCGL